MCVCVSIVCADLIRKTSDIYDDHAIIVIICMAISMAMSMSMSTSMSM